MAKDSDMKQIISYMLLDSLSKIHKIKLKHTIKQWF